MAHQPDQICTLTSKAYWAKVVSIPCRMPLDGCAKITTHGQHDTHQPTQIRKEFPGIAGRLAIYSKAEYRLVIARNALTG